MLTINGKKFAKNDKEFTESLFHSDGTCVGFYKRNKKSIALYNMQKEKIGVVNRWGVLCKAKKLENGKYWYSYATIPEIGEPKSFLKHKEEIEKLSVSHEFRKGEIELCFC